MGYLLKEALKTLCGINHWAYAVFWKIGFHNPKLLIWEEYYYGPESFSGLRRGPLQDSQAGDKVHFLLNKMMMDHHVKIVGEGLVGRSAFTGIHQWIIPSENLHGEFAYSPEVLTEMHEQFSAGIQTVAVIPVLPHGVLQFGSYFKIAEDVGFLNEASTLLHQLSQVPGVLLSDNGYSESQGCLNHGDMSQQSDTIRETDCFGYYAENYSARNPFFEGQTSYSSNGSSVKAEVITDSNLDAWIDQLSSSPFDLKPAKDAPTISRGGENLNITELFHGSTMGDGQTQLGDDISDIFGNLCNNLTGQESPAVGNSDSGIFSSICSDHLLDAVVSKARPCPKEESFSTLTNLSSSSAQKGKGVNQTISAVSKKPPEPNKTNRRRLKPGENPRPRPKDRQMIQDRVKELREIVPNGAKCSIDSLLERTIKHMLFLQSVAKHADKLNQTVESKVIEGGGATWAYEIGSQSMVCPIVVEDLNQPRQMLIEMLCEERGSFLEIADVIRGLGLTILKGTMQTRNDDKIWSQFVVEANRDVTRMEIFMWLVRVLEQSPRKCDVDEKMTMNRAAASVITATGDLRYLP